MKHFILSILFSLSIPSAFPWGSTGHRIVGEIAERHLTKEAQQFVRKYLGTERLSHASVWADEIRSDKEKSQEIGKRWGQGLSQPGNGPVNIAYWHYVSIPKGWTYSQSPKNPFGDIVWGMRKMDSVLRDSKTKDHHKREAIRLLAHYIGDIHQPLHAGVAGDRGGNYCWVKFFPRIAKNVDNPKDFGENKFRNLHEVFDTDLIDASNLTFTDYAAKIDRPNSIVLAENDLTKERAFDKLSPTQLKKVFSQTRSRWQKSAYVDWANESAALTAFVYPNERDSENAMPGYCFKSRKTKIEAKNVPTLSYAERDKYLRIVDYRLVQAGVRLAHALDQIAKGKLLK
jgi:hypothetical protein